MRSIEDLTGRSNTFARLVRIIPEKAVVEEIPEPPLVDFMKKNRLQFGEIADGKLKVSGVSSEGEESKITGRYITAEEIDQVKKWTEEHPQENPQLHFNMEGLKPLSNSIALSKSAAEPIL